MPKTLVAKLVPYIDAGDIHVEGVIVGEKGFYDCPIRILVYGTSEPTARAALEARLKADKLLKATQLKETRPKPPPEERQRASMGLKGQFTGGAAQPELSLEELAQTSQAIQFRAAEDNLKTIAMDEATLSKLPMASQPEALMSQLLPYQLQGLAWLQVYSFPWALRSTVISAVSKCLHEVLGSFYMPCYVNADSSSSIVKGEPPISASRL